ncbi:prolipoprotein diacylglyceryl transferase [Ornithinicoccus hortensis]|uniref:Phosphatidylglycerol--prolipoprotein diacylglyceryl transferase n=1 Tax=Ornithinicoccus hortensis TaxID=82346 RepID=A0A542YSJ0_9MICO|nr:prolipoprotein diacylglyceryl transferase [Ornithinicoccus hortensis]
MTGLVLPASLPSPVTGVWWLGPLPVRAYALCILLGIVAAIWITSRRIRARGGTGQEIYDIALWAIILGILGGRLYHVISSPRAYFGQDGNIADVVKIWEGGLGIWGAIALGAVGAWIGCRRYGHNFLDIADAMAPGLLVAQALGRWGNWFNNELYGGPSDAPWALTIHQWDQSAGEAVRDADGNAVVLGTFQPTFLYESLWCLLVAGVLLVLDRRFRFARGQVIALYVMGYTLGRLFFELMRTDPAEVVFGQRINVWVSIGVFLIGLAIFLAMGRRKDYPVRGPALDLTVRDEAEAEVDHGEGAAAVEEVGQDAAPRGRSTRSP